MTRPFVAKDGDIFLYVDIKSNTELINASLASLILETRLRSTAKQK